MNFFQSTKPQRNIHRFNAGIELASTMLGQIDPSVQIPMKIAQTAASIHAIFNDDTTPYEKGMGIVQTLLTTAHVGLLITLLYGGISCAGIASMICTSIVVCELLYDGLLLSGWALSEINKLPSESYGYTV